METDTSNNIIKNLHSIYNKLADQKSKLLTKTNITKIFFENSLIDICEYNIFDIYYFLEMLSPNSEEIPFEHFISLVFYIYNKQIKQIGKTDPSLDEIPEISEMSEENVHNILNENPDLMNSTENLIKVLMNREKGVIYDDICYPDFNFDTVKHILDSEQVQVIGNYSEGLQAIFDEYAKTITERQIRIINFFDVVNIVWRNNIANNLNSNNDVANIIQYFFMPDGVSLSVLEDIFDNPDLKNEKNEIERMLRLCRVDLEKVNYTFSSFVMLICCSAVHTNKNLETKEDFINNFEDYFVNVLELSPNKNPHDEIDINDMSANSFKEDENRVSNNLAEAKNMQTNPYEYKSLLQDCLDIFDKELPDVSGPIRETQNVLPNHSNTLYTNKLEVTKFKFPINKLNVEVQEENRLKQKAKEDREIAKARKPEKKDKKGPVLPKFWEEKSSDEKDIIKTFGHETVEDLKQRFLKQSYKEVLLNNYVYPSLIREVLVIPKSISKEVILQ